MSRVGTNRGRLFVKLFGGFQTAGPRPETLLVLERTKTRALLAVLALVLGEMVPRGKLTALLWAEQSEDAARHALRQSLLDLRQALAKAGVNAIRTEADLIGLEPSSVVVDAVHFERQVAHGGPEALREAVTLYRGDLLEGFSLKERAFEDWLRAARERLRSQAVTAMKVLLGHHVRRRATEAAAEIAVRLLALEPFDETVHRTLMRLYAESGRRSAALRQYELCVDVLDRELGVEPEADTRELYRRLILQRGDPPQASGVARKEAKQRSRASRSRGASVSDPTSPFIGRDSVLEWFSALWEGARRGQPQLAVVFGEAGIGKSRFVAEVALRAKYRPADFLIGRGREGEDVLLFGPWVEALRPLLSQDLIRRLTPVTRADLARLFPEIADGAVPPPRGMEEAPRIFEAVAHLLRVLSTERPLVVVIEDLHWCDDMTVRLLKFLPRRLGGRPIVLLGTARPENVYAGTPGGALLEALRHDESCASHALSPLLREQVLELFLAVFGARDADTSRPLAERVWQLSEGNPFVTIECARAVRQRGAPAPEGALGVPDAVRSLTLRQFATLSQSAARLADAAAVVGRDFDAALIRHTTGLSQAHLADALEELIRRQVLREVEGRFDFRHDRIREATYGQLLGPRRNLLHRQVAQALETVYANDLDPHYGVIGAHYHRAGIWSNAAGFLARAGFQAWDRGAGREALTCFEMAMAAITHLPDTEQWRELHVRLRMAASGASLCVGAYERGVGHLREAEQLVGALGDRRWHCRVATKACFAYLADGAIERALVLGEQALDIALETGEPRVAVAPRYQLGMAEAAAGNYHRSVTHLTTLLHDDAGGPEPHIYVPYWEHPPGMRASICYRQLINFTQLGEFDAGRRLAEQCFRESDALGDRFGTLRLHAYVGLGKLESGAGDLDSAVRAYENARALCREDFNGDLLYMIRWGLGLAYALLGRPSEGLVLFDKVDTALFRSVRLLHHGLALVAAGRIDEAATISRDALSLAREGGNRPSEAGAHRLLGEVAKAQNPMDHEGMEQHMLRALELADACRMRPLAARCHLRLAWLYERTGSPKRARHAACAESLLAEMGNPLSVDAAGVH
jgi:DNA-binding SARP family transcriptional activator